MKGKIVAGCLAPHPPHLLYALNPEQNIPEATGSGAWNSLLQGYTSLQKSLTRKEFDVLIVHTPHWKTIMGHHLLFVPHFEGLSVDPIFPNLFRFNYNINIDIELSKEILDQGKKEGLEIHPMINPNFRVDYGTITSCHLSHPDWSVPIVVISSSRAYFYYGNDVGDQEMLALGRATRRAIENTGRKAVLLASTSLSHRHFTEEPEDPEDPRFESIYNKNQAEWDERILNLIHEGKCQQILSEMPDFIDQSVSECKDGSFTWLLGALQIPTYPGIIHGYGSVIGTGNAVVEWVPEEVL